ncbi:metalloprotease [Microbotryomycetes sp. JL221]|nr:metalloprotease [Microbotryomycetes sp. JL221]
MATTVGNRPSRLIDLDALGDGWIARRDDASRQHAVFEQGIETSPNDERHYRLIMLENGMRALLISDKSTDKSAAALSVNIGHLSDPDDLPGLAHYCEHMLFLGTETFPDESSYKSFLTANSGSSNAYTSLEETNYYFDVHPSAFPEALKRHSAFFKCPLFAESCTEREVNAVDSEFRRNLQLDARRLFQLGKATSSKNGKYWKFGTGSKETLWTEPTARGQDGKLIDWYSRQYSSNLMSLVVLSSHSLDELANIVIEEYSPVPNLDLTKNVFESALSDKELGRVISYRTIKDTPLLRIEFPLPDLNQYWSSLPGRFISHFLGDEGPGSVLAELKKRGWATGLDASSSGGASGFEFFRINVGLTALGLVNRIEVIRIVFEYLRLLSTTPPQNWVHEEERRLGEIAWQFKENGQPTPVVNSLASRLATAAYASNKILIGPYFATEFNSELLIDLLARLTPDQCRIFVGSKEPLEHAEWDQKERYYGTEYRTDAMDSTDLSSPPSVSAKLALPEPNIFIPERLDLVTKTKVEHPAKRPNLIKQTSQSRLFYKKDDTWLVPRATAYFLLKTPLADESPVAAIKSQMFTTLIEESLNEYTYAATLAGLGYSVGNEPDGLQLVVSGYSDKLAVLLKVVLNKIKNFEIDSKQFEVVHERLNRAYKNVKLNNPSGLADSHLRHLTRQTHWTFDQRLEALKGLQPSDIESHGRQLVKALSIEGLVHGNVLREDALEMIKLVETVLAPELPLPNDYHRALLLPLGSNLVCRPQVPSSENVNSAAVVYFQVGSITNHDEMVRLHLFAQIVKVPVFSTLRTKEQLGYIVQSSTWTSNNIQGFRVVVQSEKSVEFLESRIETLWLDPVSKHFENMSDEEFEKHKIGLINRKLEKVKSLSQETSRYWSEIEDGTLDFFHREREAALISELTKQDVFDFFKRFVHPSSDTRVKLSILMRSQRLQPEALSNLVDAIKRTDLDSQRATAGCEKLLKAKPTFVDASKLVDEVFNGKTPNNVKDELDKLKLIPDVPDNVTELFESDVEDFRKTLERGPAAEAVNDFSTDLEAHL